MISEAWLKVQNQINSELAFKQDMLSIALDGSGDYLINAKFFNPSKF